MIHSHNSLLASILSGALSVIPVSALIFPVPDEATAAWLTQNIQKNIDVVRGIASDVSFEAKWHIDCNTAMYGNHCAKILTLINISDHPVKVNQVILNNKPDYCSVTINKTMTMGDTWNIWNSAVAEIDVFLLGKPSCGEEIVRVDIKTERGTVILGK